jgi:2-succinyl-5-enolpyruvyl-6-hydroxy-3-cyclohexene-1-carboxylate synthase
MDGSSIPANRNLNPLHGCTTHLRVSIEEFLQILTNQSPYPQNQSHSYLQQWKELEIHVRTHLDRTLTELTDGFEGKIAWILSQHLPAHTPLFVANSMPSRDMEWFWAPSDRAIQPYFNRGEAMALMAFYPQLLEWLIAIVQLFY